MKIPDERMTPTKRYIPHIPETDKERMVVVGCGFAGLKFIRKMLGQQYQIVLIDRNNFHQFQPLLYQVATSGLEPSAISFPIRKILQKQNDIHFRIAEVHEILEGEKEILTNIGHLKYDHLVLAMGATTNYFGQKNIEQYALPMKSAADSILIRNTILENFEAALLQDSEEEMSSYLNVVLVGGGPTGVEMAGALAEMKKYIFPKDYPELDLSRMRIVLYEASPVLLSGMSGSASAHALKYLQNLGVEVYLNTRVEDYDGVQLKLSDKTRLASKTVIWAAGIRANTLMGIPSDRMGPQGRIRVDRFHRVEGMSHVYVLGDLCYMETPLFPEGHPQVAQVAIQQAGNLSSNLKKLRKMGTSGLREFEYKDKGSMATIGRNLAVADLPHFRLKGFPAWVLWSIVHLFTIFGAKNQVFTFLNWMWKYFTYDQSLRLLIRPKLANNAPMPGQQNSPGSTSREKSVTT